MTSTVPLTSVSPGNCGQRAEIFKACSAWPNCTHVRRMTVFITYFACSMVYSKCVCTNNATHHTSIQESLFFYIRVNNKFCRTKITFLCWWRMSTKSSEVNNILITVKISHFLYYGFSCALVMGFVYFSQFFIKLWLLFPHYIVYLFNNVHPLP